MRKTFERIGYYTSKSFNSLIGSDKNIQTVHFLHIGKNAGTQIGHILDQVNQSQERVRFEKHSHGVQLKSLPQDDGFFFSIRDPAARFRSGFYSRKRMGKPRIYKAWSPHESRLFDEFEHANDLAESLYDEGPRGRAALCAMLSIGHLGRGQVDWFKGSGFFFDLRPPAWIIRQENLRADMETLLRRLGLDCDFSVSTDPLTAHTNDYSQIPRLSEKAIDNLKRWHAPDYAFYRQCEDWMAAQSEPAL